MHFYELAPDTAATNYTSTGLVTLGQNLPLQYTITQNNNNEKSSNQYYGIQKSGMGCIYVVLWVKYVLWSSYVCILVNGWLR